jgi:hypothetical protein
MVETEAVRYLYHPLESLYLVIVTTKSSNIVEDLDTLHVLAKLVSRSLKIESGSQSILSYFACNFRSKNAFTKDLYDLFLCNLKSGLKILLTQSNLIFRRRYLITADPWTSKQFANKLSN